MKTFMRLCLHVGGNLVNIYRNEKCFGQELKAKMKRNAVRIVSETIKQKGEDAPELLRNALIF
jgi:diketogulonate reductase-like aldo/keto reductase